MIRQLKDLNYEVNMAIEYEDHKGWKRTPAQTDAEQLGNCTDIALLKAASLQQQVLQGAPITFWLERCWIDNNFLKPHMVVIVEVSTKRWWQSRAHKKTLVLDCNHHDVAERDWFDYMWLPGRGNQWSFSEAMEMIK